MNTTVGEAMPNPPAADPQPSYAPQSATQSAFPLAPPLEVSEWLNTPQPITLDGLRGRVVLLHTFQMLCPGCVSYGNPQAAKAWSMFGADEGGALAVIGLHTVFEHHAVMSAEALRVFLHEYKLPFPVGIDMPGEGGGLPRTMRAYDLGGTPSTVLIDKGGRIRLSHLGRIDDMALGAVIGQLLSE